MKPGFFVHSPCVTHVSHLISSSAHAPVPALAASATSHQPHARRHVAALPPDPKETRRQRQGASPRTGGVAAAHMKRRLRTQCSSLAHPAHFDVVSLHDGSACWRSAAAGRREAGRGGVGGVHALQLRGHSAHNAHAALSGAADARSPSAHASVRALGGKPTFPHEAGVLRALALRHPCLALDILVGTRARASAGSIRNITPAARATACSRPATRPERNAASASGRITAHRWRGGGAHEAAVAHAMLLLGPSCASLVVHAWSGSPIAAEITRKRALFTHESVVELALPIPHPMLTVRGSVRASARDDHFFAGTDRVENDQARVLADVLACRQMPQCSVYAPLLEATPHNRMPVKFRRLSGRAHLGATSHCIGSGASKASPRAAEYVCGQVVTGRYSIALWCG